MNHAFFRLLCTLTLLCCANAAVVIAQVEPSGGVQAVTLVPGATVEIEWEDDLQASRVDLALWNGDEGRETLIATNIETTPGFYEWQIPSSTPPGERYRFVVRDHQQPRRAIRSRSWVTINRVQPHVSTMKEEQPPSQMQLFPMPAHDDLTITWSGHDVDQIDILDLEQRVLQRWDVDLGDTSKQVDIRTLPTGTYVIRLHHQTGGTSTERLTIAR